MSEPQATPLLVSSARIVLQNPVAIHDMLCNHLAEHIQVKHHEDGALFVTDFGTARTDINGDTVLVALESPDETGLSFLKLMVAEHLLEFAGEQKPVMRWSGDARIGQLLPYFRELRVVSIGNVTPRMRRIVLRGQDLARFATGGLHVRLLFPPDGASPQWPVNGEDGRPRWPHGAAKLDVRVYTIRFIDISKGEVTIDMLLHDDAENHPAPGAGFARDAQPGDIIGMTGPFGGALAEADRYILLGDETALPVIGRMLEAMPATGKASVFIEVSGPEEEQELVSSAHIDVHWLHRDAADPSRTNTLAKILRLHPWLSDGAGTPFIWAGCEHGPAREIRQFVMKERGLARDMCSITAYWRQEGGAVDTGSD